MSVSVAASTTRRERWAWYLYDFGNSAYAAIVLLAVYSAYFKGEVVGGAEGSRLWGLSVSIAMLVVAVTSPVLGAIADFSGAKKRFLFLFTAMSVVCTGLLFFVQKGTVVQGMLFFILAEIGYRSAQVFYNALLPEIAAPEEIGTVSGIGWAVGSAGGVVCLLIVLPMIAASEGTFAVRLSFVITALFFGLAALPVFLWLKEKAQPQPLPAGDNYLSVAFRQLRRTIRTAGSFREFLKFVLAFLIYNDGVIMALDFAAIIGATLFGIDQKGLILFIIMVHITNVIGAYLFGVLVDRWGGKPALAGTILLMAADVAALYFLHTPLGFQIVGAIAGVAMAGIQSVSRTMVSMFAPEGQSAEFYGFFAVAGRTSSFIGPGVFGWLAASAAHWYERQGLATLAAEQAGLRLALWSIVAFLLIGLLLLTLVNERRAREEARRRTQG